MKEQAQLTCTPIGVVRSPLKERSQAARQSMNATHVSGTIELFSGSGFEHALEDIDEWSHLWVLFWFHLNDTWRPKVTPPRSDEKRGVFATRSPYRPNPIGLSVVELQRREGLVMHVAALDILDGSPVLDLKPYVAYTDALHETKNGWLERGRDPVQAYVVEVEPLALRQLDFLGEAGRALRDALERTLSSGPGPQPYRRIRSDGDGYVIAIKDWRARFVVAGQRAIVIGLSSGYRARQLAEDGDRSLDVHRRFCAQFPTSR